MVKVAKLIFLILGLSHLGCCSWHVIGRTASGNWYVADSVERNEEFGCLMRFYWSMTSTVSGGSFITPTDTVEIIFAIPLISFGGYLRQPLDIVLVGSTDKFSLSTREQKDMFRVLRRYLCQHSGDAKLAALSRHQVIERMSVVNRLSQEDVGL